MNMNLPEFWQIKRTAATYDIINDYMNKRWNVENGFWARDGFVNNKVERTGFRNDCVEISFHDFERLVLNQNVERTYELW